MSFVIFSLLFSEKLELPTKSKRKSFKKGGEKWVKQSVK